MIKRKSSLPGKTTSGGFLKDFAAIGAFVFVLVVLVTVSGLFLFDSFKDIQSGPRILWLGAETIELNSALSAQYNIPTSDGLLVSRIFLGSPAEDAGLKVGDIIQRWNGVTITSQKQIEKLIGKSAAGQKITLSVSRSDRPILIYLQLGVRPGGTPMT